jgi:predicted nuclease with TOPRIM domain
MAKAKEDTKKKSVSSDRFTVAEVREQLLATMIKNNQDIMQCAANSEQLLEELNDIKTKMAILEENQKDNHALIEKQSSKLDEFAEFDGEISTKVDTMAATLVDHIDKYDSNVKAQLEDKAEQLKGILNVAEPLEMEAIKPVSVDLRIVYVLIVIMIIMNAVILYRI